jgi:flagellar motor switch protein FliM
VKPQRAFVAERVAAQHCAELLRRGPEPAELLPALQRLGEKIARHLAPALSMLLGGDEPAVTPLAPQEQSEIELVEAVGVLAANSLLATTAPGVTLLASVDGTAMLRLVDRAFGGKGEASGPLPERFPHSAELMIAKVEVLLAKALGAALGQGELRVLRRDARLAELTPFPAGARLAVLPIEVMEGAKAPWKLTLALPLAMLPKLLGGTDMGGAPRSPGAADPAAAPFADVPLPLTARLVDMKVSLSTIAALEPGTVLPVAVARAVPIAIGEQVIARGTVGTQDDCVALKLTQLEN